jgi:CRISPR-associated protein Csx14
MTNEAGMAEDIKIEASIPVDLFNPGQVFACFGFLEAADVLCGEAEAYFDWSDAVCVRFYLRARGSKSPIEHVLEFLDRAEARAEAVEGSRNIEAWKMAWGPSPIVVTRSNGYPFPDPTSPATLVCALVADGHRLVMDHWGDDTVRDNVKFWAGAGGYPGVGLARDALDLVRGKARAAAGDPFALGAPQSSSFRLDWRRDYVPIDAGFSLNAHTSMETRGFPLVELLAALGLGHARPRRPKRRDKLVYEYGVVGRGASAPAPWLPPSILRAALGTPGVDASRLPWPMRRFRMRLDWPGKKGQARSITTVTEETPA